MAGIDVFIQVRGLIQIYRVQVQVVCVYQVMNSVAGIICRYHGGVLSLSVHVFDGAARAHG